MLESYCWMYSTWNIPREYKGACSGGDQVTDKYFLDCLLESDIFPGHANHHYSVQLILPVGASLPHIHGCDLLPAQDVLDHDGGGAHEVLREGDHHQVH